MANILVSLHGRKLGLSRRGELIGFGYDTAVGPGTYRGSYWSTQDAITAFATGGQTSAVPLLARVNRISTVANVGDSVALPASDAGDIVVVINDAANACQVFGVAGGTDTINDVAGATGISVAGGTLVVFFCPVTGKWYGSGAGENVSAANGTFTGTVSISGLLSESAQDALSANSGGVQTGATAITANIARFTTVGGNGYSAVLPAAAAGLEVTVINSGAHILAVFPAGSDEINASTNAYPVQPGSVATFAATVAGFWEAAPANPVQQAYNTNSSTTGVTLGGSTITGGSVQVSLNMTGALGAGAAATLPTVGALVAAMIAAGIAPIAGMTYELDFMNTSSGNFAWTITTNTGWTLTGTMTVAQNTYRKCYVTLTSLTAATLQSVGEYAITAGI